MYACNYLQIHLSYNFRLVPQRSDSITDFEKLKLDFFRYKCLVFVDGKYSLTNDNHMIPNNHINNSSIHYLVAYYDVFLYNFIRIVHVTALRNY